MSKLRFDNSSEPAKQNECQIMLYNVQKGNNIGNIIRSAVAFGLSTVVVVGERKFNTFGNQNTNSFIKFAHYPDADTACVALKERGFKIVGVEIGAASKNIVTHPFSGPTVFMLGNEGAGLSEKQQRLCDELVYIPQYGKGTASLNVSNAAAIVLHHYATWAAYKEQVIEGEKFLVEDDAKVVSKRPREGEEFEYTEYELKVREERRRKREARENQAVEGVCETQVGESGREGNQAAEGCRERQMERVEEGAAK